MTSVKPITALSFGGGRQTTAMLLMAVNGELPRPDYVVFADTGAEWPETYDYMARQVKPLCEKEGLPFVVVREDRETLYEWYWRLRSMPKAFNRSCTDHYKVRPLHRWAKGIGEVTFQVGFSADEAGRSKKSSNLKRTFPLIEQRLTLADCEAAIKAFGWPFPMRSACIFCCFQHPNRARLLFERHPELFETVGLLEDNALARAQGYYILGNRPWRSWGVQQANIFGDDWNYGCADGYCFR